MLSTQSADKDKPVKFVYKSKLAHLMLLGYSVALFFDIVVLVGDMGCGKSNILQR